MDPKISELLQRQAEWQKARRNLPFPEKLRIVERIRDSVIALRNAPLIDAAAQSDQSFATRTVIPAQAGIQGPPDMLENPVAGFPPAGPSKNAERSR